MDKRPFLDFKEIKTRVSFLDVLDRYKVQVKKVNNTQLKANCPLPSHTSKDPDTFCVNTEKSVWYCHSDSCKKNGHRAGGNVIDFVSTMENCSPYEAAARLNEWYPNGSSPVQTKREASGQPETPSPPPAPAAPEVNRPLAFELRGVAYHEYLEHRGISQETASHFGVGFFPGKGSMVGRVVIPIRNEQGELVAYAGRSLNGDEPKYKLPAGFHKAHVLYNLNAVGAQAECIVVCEGFFDCYKIHQAGFPNVAALMGRTLSEEQAKLLARFPKIVLMLDGDAPGRESEDSLTLALSKTHYVRQAIVPDGTQPDGLSSVDIQNLLKGVLP
jgi:DNA primase